MPIPTRAQKCRKAFKIHEERNRRKKRAKKKKKIRRRKTERNALSGREPLEFIFATEIRDVMFWVRKLSSGVRISSLATFQTALEETPTDIPKLGAPCL